MQKVSFQINQKKHVVSGPSKWEECTPKQYVEIHRVWAESQLEKAAVFQILTAMYGILPKDYQYFFDENKLAKIDVPTEEREEIIQTGIQLLKTAVAIFDTPATAKWLLPALNVGTLLKSTMHGPADGLSNLTFEEFIFVDSYYQKKEYDKFCAVLYQKDDKEERPKFNANLIGKRKLWFEKWPPYLKNAIVMNYEGCLLRFSQVFGHLFAIKQPQQTDAHQPNQPANWLDLAIEAAGLDPIKFNALKSENLYIVFRMLDKNIADAKRHQRNAKKQAT